MKSIISKLTINFSHSDVNEESQIIGPDKIITLEKKTTVHQTSMKSIISHFTMYFSYSDETSMKSMGDKIITFKKNQLFVETSKVYHHIFQFR